MTSRWWHDNIAYEINVSHRVLAPGTGAPPARTGDVEVEFVLKEFSFLQDAEHDSSTTSNMITRERIEVPLSELSSLRDVSSNLTKLVLTHLMVNLRLPGCCVQGELIRQLAVDAHAAEMFLKLLYPVPAGPVVFTVDITANNYSLDYAYDDDAVLEESFQEGAGSVKPARATEESIKELERFVIRDGDDQETCTVCMDAMEPEGTRGARMPCGHVYHENCIVVWLGVSCSCPICRYQLPTYDYDQPVGS